MDFLMNLMRGLPVLKKHKSPNVAAVIGFLTGGIGLGLYCWSFIDFIFPVLAIIVLGAILKTAGWIVGAAMVGLYGYVRVSDSNARLDKAAEEKLHPKPEAAA